MGRRYIEKTFLKTNIRTVFILEIMHGQGRAIGCSDRSTLSYNKALVGGDLLDTTHTLPLFANHQIGQIN